MFGGSDDGELEKVKKVAKQQEVLISNLKSQHQVAVAEISQCKTNEAALATTLSLEQQRANELEKAYQKAKTDKEKAALQVANLQSALDNAKRSEAETSKGRRRGDVECDLQVQRVEAEKIRLEEQVASLEKALAASKDETARAIEAHTSERPRRVGGVDPATRVISLENQVQALQRENGQLKSASSASSGASRLAAATSPVRRRAPRRSSISGPTPAFDSNEAVQLRTELETAQSELKAALERAQKSKDEAFKASNERIAAQRVADRESREAREKLDDLREELRWATAERDELKLEQAQDTKSASLTKELKEVRAQLEQGNKRIDELTAAVAAAEAQRDEATAIASNADAAEALEAREQLQARVAELEEEVQNVKASASSSSEGTSETPSEELVALQARIAELEEEQRNSRALLDAAAAESPVASDSWEEEKAELVQRVDIAQKSLDDAVNQLDALRAKVEEALQRASSAEVDADAAREELKQLQAAGQDRLETAEAQLREAESQLAQLHDELETRSKAYEATLDDLRAKSTEHEDHIADLLDTLRKREQEQSKVRQYVQRLSATVQRRFRISNNDSSIVGDESMANMTLSDMSMVAQGADAAARTFEMDLFDEFEQLKQYIDEADDRQAFQRVEAQMHVKSLQRAAVPASHGNEVAAAITLATTVGQLEATRSRLREIEARHVALQRAADDAARVELLEKRLAAHDEEGRLWAAHIAQVEQQLSTYKRRVAELEACLTGPAASIAQLLTDKAELEARVARRTLQISEHQRELKVERMNLTLAQDAAEDLIQKEETMTQRITQLEADLHEAEASRDETKQSGEALVAQLEDQSQELARLEKELADAKEAQQQAEAASAAVAAASASSNEHERSSDEAIFAELASKTRAHAVLTAELAEAREECEKVKQSLELDIQELEQLQAEIVGLTQQSQSANAACKAAELRVKELEQSSAAELAEREEALADAQARLSAAEAELKATSARADSLGAQAEELDAVKAQLTQEREALSAAQLACTAAQSDLEESRKEAAEVKAERDALLPLREQADNLNELVVKAEAELQVTQQEVEALRQTANSGDAENLAKISELTATLEEAQTRIEVAEGCLREREDQFEALTKQREHVMRQFNKRDKDFWEIKEELASSQEEAEKLEQKAEGLEKNLTEQKSLVAARDAAQLVIQAAADQYKRQYETASRTVEESNAKYSAAEAEHAKVKAAHAAAKKEVQSLQLEQERMTLELNALTAEKTSLAAALAEAQNGNGQSGDVEALNARIEQLEEELSVKAMEAEDYDTKTFEHLKAMTKLQLRLKRLQTKYDDLSQSIAATSQSNATQGASPSGAAAALATEAAAAAAPAPAVSTPGTSRKRSKPDFDPSAAASSGPSVRAIYVSPSKTFTPVRRVRSTKLASSSVTAHAAATGGQVFNAPNTGSSQQRTVSNPSALIEQGLVVLPPPPANDARSASGLVDRTNTPSTASNERRQASAALSSTKPAVTPSLPATGAGERKAVHGDLMQRLHMLKGYANARPAASRAAIP